MLAEADPSRGRFRSFLRTVCADFLANRRDHEQAKKRGGGRAVLSMRIFDRSWALTLLGRVLDGLGRQYHEAGKSAIFEALRDVLAGDSDMPSYAAVAARLGMSEGAARVAAHRLRRRYGELLRQEIAATVAIRSPTLSR